MGRAQTLGTRGTTRRAALLGGAKALTVAALAAPVAAAACGSEAPAPRSAAPVTLRWGSYFSPLDRGRLFQPVADEYRADHPNVQFEMWHGIADYNAKLATAFAAGDPPELFGTTLNIVRARAREGNVLDLGSWYGQANRKKVVHPAALAWVTVDGKLVGFAAHDVFAMEWYYNATVFAELRLAEPASPDELIAAATRLAARGVKYPLLLTDDGSRSGFFQAVQAQTLGSTGLQRAVERKNYDVPGLAAAWQSYEAMFQRGAVSPGTVDLAGGGRNNALASADGGIVPVHTGYYPAIKRVVEAAGLARLGLFKEPVLFTAKPLSKWSAGWGMVWAIPKATRLAKEAQDFLGYWASVPVQRRLAAEGVGTPPVPEVWDTIADPMLRGTVAHLRDATAESLYMHNFLPDPVVTAWMDGLLAVGRRQKSIQEAIGDMNAAAQTAA